MVVINIRHLVCDQCQHEVSESQWLKSKTMHMRSMCYGCIQQMLWDSGKYSKGYGESFFEEMRKLRR